MQHRNNRDVRFSKQRSAISPPPRPALQLGGYGPQRLAIRDFMRFAVAGAGRAYPPVSIDHRYGPTRRSESEISVSVLFVLTSSGCPRHTCTGTRRPETQPAAGSETCKSPTRPRTFRCKPGVSTGRTSSPEPISRSTCVFRATPPASGGSEVIPGDDCIAGHEDP